MAKNQTERLKPRIIKDDINCCDVITGLTGYKSAQVQYSRTELEATQKAMTDARKAEVKADVAARTARQVALRAEWEFHNRVLGAKSQIKAQYGEDSAEIKSIGLKRKSEYKRPTRRQSSIPFVKAA